jgi:hypothetical protein
VDCRQGLFEEYKWRIMDCRQVLRSPRTASPLRLRCWDTSSPSATFHLQNQNHHLLSGAPDSVTAQMSPSSSPATMYAARELAGQT